MSRILHLSDLHYGRERPALETPLLQAIEALDPDLVAISGDFTQRARTTQFARARAFLDRIRHKVLAVPGNHDTPLDNPWLRLVRPWARYRAAIGPELEPGHVDDEIAVIGVNTVNRFAWQRGRISSRTVDHVCRGFEDAGERVRVVVLHHPLEHGPEVEKRLMKGAGKALRRLQECGADIVLSGHLHNTVIAPFSAAPGLLFVQAGTGLSSRVRGEPNMFNLVDAARGEMHITTFGAREAAFVPFRTARFTRHSGVWTRADDTPA